MPQPVIFAEPWWLDAVAPGAWGEARVERGGQLFARLPYVARRWRGLTFLTMPPLTQTLGPWLRPYTGKYANQLSEEKQLMTQLIERLPRYHQFEQNWHYSVTNWLPFYWQGFGQTTRYTYVIEDLSDLDRVYAGFAHAKQKNIKRAQELVEVREDLPARQFYENHALTLAKEGKRINYTFDLLDRIYSACREHQAGKTFYAADGQGNMHAAILVIWNAESAYYLLSSIDPDYRNSGSASLLVWEALRYLAGKTRRFDFEGSMIEGVENSFRAFGATQKAYSRVSKINSRPLRVYRDVRSWFEWRHSGS